MSRRVRRAISRSRISRCAAAAFSSGYLWEQLEFPLHAAGRLLLNLCMLGPLVTRHQLVVVHDATVQALPDNFSLALPRRLQVPACRVCAGAPTRR